MLKLHTIKISFIILFVFFVLPLNRVKIAEANDTSNWLDMPVTTTFQNEPLKKVLQNISEQTGISIAYDQTLANEKITGNYQKIKISDAIDRLFKNKNKTIQVNEKNKTIIIKTFGAKAFLWAATGQKTDTNKQASNPVTLADLEDMHAEQTKIYKDRISSDKEILEGGLTRGELQAMHRLQAKEHQSYVDENKSKQLKALHKQQADEYKKYLSNKKVVTEDGLTHDELQELHSKQSAEYQTILTQKDTLSKETSPNKDLNLMHKKQIEEYHQAMLKQ